jgi:hypothetical protein
VSSAAPDSHASSGPFEIGSKMPDQGSIITWAPPWDSLVPPSRTIRKRQDEVKKISFGVPGWTLKWAHLDFRKIIYSEMRFWIQRHRQFFSMVNRYLSPFEIF